MGGRKTSIRLISESVLLVVKFKMEIFIVHHPSLISLYNIIFVIVYKLQCKIAPQVTSPFHLRINPSFCVIVIYFKYHHTYIYIFII